MSRSLKIAVLRDRYPTTFMTPRMSRHKIVRKRFIPFNYATQKLEGLTILEPCFNIDLIHAHNRIPIGARRFIVDFESALPRRYSLTKDNSLTRFMQAQVESHRCRRIVAMSHFAKRSFLAQHADSPALADMTAKLMVRHPNVNIPDIDDALAGNLSSDKLVLTFIGAHFGRKGGCVAVKIAEKANQRGLPVHVNVISSLMVGGDVWTDPTQEGFFESYFKLLELSNVTHMGSQPNDVVCDVLRNSHFSLLTTFGDTFGFSAFESMAQYTPAITTNVCALPEFVSDGINGIMIPLETDDIGNWQNMGWERRGDAAYARHFHEEVDRMAEETLARLELYFNTPDAMSELRLNARRTAEAMFGAPEASEAWDALYERVVAEPIESAPSLDLVLDVSSSSIGQL